MAKTRKQDAEKEGTPHKKTSAPKKAGKSPHSAAPLIDTSLAAEAAANMVAHRASMNANRPAGAGAKAESSAFKQMKQNLTKPVAQGLGDILGNTGGQKKSNQPFGGPKQVGGIL